MDSPTHKRKRADSDKTRTDDTDATQAKNPGTGNDDAVARTERKTDDSATKEPDGIVGEHIGSERESWASVDELDDVILPAIVKNLPLGSAKAPVDSKTQFRILSTAFLLYGATRWFIEGELGVVLSRHKVKTFYGVVDSLDDDFDVVQAIERHAQQLPPCSLQGPGSGQPVVHGCWL